MHVANSTASSKPGKPYPDFPLFRPLNATKGKENLPENVETTQEIGLH